jgi:AcrR family transcriptional regulator
MARQTTDTATSTRASGLQRRRISREEILAVAARLFQDQGYRATNLQQVADEFGVQRPAIYYYFANKAEILVEIHNALLDRLVTQLEEIGALELTPDEAFSRIIRGQVAIFAEHISELGVFLSNESELPAPVRAKVQRQKRRYQEGLETIFRQGVADGDFAELDVHIATFTLVGMTHWMYRWYRASGASSPDDVADIILRLARQGYLKDERGS